MEDMEFGKLLDRVLTTWYEKEPEVAGKRKPKRVKDQWGLKKCVSVSKLVVRKDGAGLDFDDYVVRKARERGLNIDSNTVKFVVDLLNAQIGGIKERQSSTFDRILRISDELEALGIEDPRIID